MQDYLPIKISKLITPAKSSTPCNPQVLEIRKWTSLGTHQSNTDGHSSSCHSPLFQPMGRRKGEVITKKLLTNSFHSYPIGQNLLTWPQIAARESGKCSLLVMFQSKNYISKQNSDKTNKQTYALEVQSGNSRLYETLQDKQPSFCFGHTERVVGSYFPIRD